ncbi:MAG: type II secretion system protein GspM [Burkholderiaceae bacterium]
MKLVSPLKTILSRFSSREKNALWLATWLMGAALLWWLMLAPALHTWRNAEQVRSKLDVQFQKMQALQAQARLLQAQTRVTPEQAQASLEVSVKQHFGSTAQLQMGGQRATITLKGASSEALAQWLAQARSQAHVLPNQASLKRSDAASTSWDGTLVLEFASR